MARIEESVEVHAPLPAVYEQWTRYEEFPEFMRGVVSVERTGPGATHWVIDAVGVRREFEARTVEAVPRERVAWESVAGDVRQAGVVTFHRIDEGTTRLMVQLELEPPGLLERLVEALGFVDRRVIDDLRDFKDHVESERRAA
ncbi:polyketide cyclase/dehydrase/lipid transport protein [Streptomyces sp. 1114.5]|uniref:SRPBCC family protein n=1 Tax=Streptomyces sp. 1114.5 TaxID=1938830 RepID=UPI000EB5BF40|nr:SRPBCC family protein [Streptomyces sp. 1114.5]RKT09891.1 polyketide cyclase/dehydrase/lipid transport protein [Streptomyces sp. 1114.5]